MLLLMQLPLVTTCLGMFSLEKCRSFSGPPTSPGGLLYAALWLPAELCLPPGDASNSPGASHFFFAELYDQMLFERYVVVMADAAFCTRKLARAAWTKTAAYAAADATSSCDNIYIIYTYIHILNIIETYIYIYSDILSDILSGIHSDLLYGILLYLASILTHFLAYMLTFFLAFYLASILTFFLASILAFYLAFYLTFYAICMNE